MKFLLMLPPGCEVHVVENDNIDLPVILDMDPLARPDKPWAGELSPMFTGIPLHKVWPRETRIEWVEAGEDVDW